MLAGVSEMEFVGLKKPSKIALALAGVSEMELKKHRMPTEKAPKTHQNHPPCPVPLSPRSQEHIFIYRYMAASQKSLF